MRIEYRVLWIDDDIENYDRYGGKIGEYIESQGFEPILKFIEDPGTLYKADGTIDIELINSYDLLLSDLNLEEEKKGNEIIKNVRESKIYTEVLLYSGNPEDLAAEMYQAKGFIERVSLNFDMSKLLEKIYQVIKLNIYKFQNVNNLRGLVMAETSEIDHNFLETLDIIVAKPDIDCCERLKSYIDKLVIEHKDSVTKKIEKFTGEEREYSTIIKDAIFDSEKKRRSILKTVCLNNFGNSVKIKEDLNAYKAEVMEKRNNLAHVVEKTDQNGKSFLVSHIVGAEGIEFSEETFIDLRKTIRKHKKNSEYILKIVKELYQ